MLSRRGFFRISAAAAAVVTASPVPIEVTETEPSLWADGVHDDADGLEFLWSESSRSKPLIIRGGTFAISRQIGGEGFNAELLGVKVKTLPGFKFGPAGPHIFHNLGVGGKVKDCEITFNATVDEDVFNSWTIEQRAFVLGLNLDDLERQAAARLN